MQVETKQYVAGRLGRLKVLLFDRELGFLQPLRHSFPSWTI